ncbi:hypothetical protein GOBAR_AA00870 [Gossypium barbadense]|uniref:Uncharacterized protein n=1 Tax=Gossypium barbadense TaxID=3634 RepID=A0A2P5YVY2_GOSBA|nr:hypothetical protein GOBAR_AA00870 [Gossypium barbadense]
MVVVEQDMAVVEILSQWSFKAHACVKLTGLPTVSKHGSVASLSYFGSFGHDRGYLSHPVLGKKFFPCFHAAVSYGRVASCGVCKAYGTPVCLACGSKKPVFNDLSNRRESRGGYSGGVRGSLVYKSCTKRILYLVVAMVVVEQDMAVVEILSQWSFKVLSNSELWSYF